jgi:acetamidase/formamidase
MKKTAQLLLVAAVLLGAGQAQAQHLPKAQHELLATPSTVAWGYYAADAPPVLRIKSGETVQVHTLITSGPTRLEGAGLPAAQVEQSLRDITDKVTNKGPGGHILTGPIFVEGATPGDVLEVRIKAIELAIPYAYNAFGPKSGFIPEDFGYAKMRIIPLDARRMVADFAADIKVPLHPFFGSMGVAPPPASGRVNSAPPGIHGGNLDNKDLVVGTTLYLPVHVPGALFFVGDGHAGQGNGEVDITALETSLVGNLEFIVHHDEHLTVPRAETPTHYISMGLNEDLTLAAKQAVRDMIGFLMKNKGLSKDDAYMLCSVAGDLNVTQVVDGTRGAHMLLPKSIFKNQKAK